MGYNTEFDGGFAVENLDRNDDFIQSRIFTIRSVQVVIDRYLAALYGVQTKVLNQAVKRNANRFPSEFMFILTEDETAELVTNCDRLRSARHSSVPMRAFSEHGVIMVASVLKSDIAAQVSVRIARAFVAMRKALASIAPIMARLEVAERRQITDQQHNEERFDAIFKARMRPRRRRRVARARSASREAVARGRDGGDFPPQKVFFEGKHYDAYSFARKLVRRAVKSIVLVDGYCDDVTLDILASKRGGLDVIEGYYNKNKAWVPSVNSRCQECTASVNGFVHVIKIEEKRTDVNLATSFLRDAYTNAADAFVIVSGDADFIAPLDLVRHELKHRRNFM